MTDAPGRYLTFGRDEWAELREATPLTLNEQDLDSLRGINESIELDEVAAIYLPLTRLLNLYVSATQTLHKVSGEFLGTSSPKVPYIIGIAGSVAVGKSTFARILQALLARWPDHPKVDLVTTDGFLYPNKVLDERGLMNRKGFPESYDTRRLLQFLRELKSGTAIAYAPVYSHVVYDIIEGATIAVSQPDIVIIEGLNVLQVSRPAESAIEFVSDYFDFSIYIDADESHIEEWYVQRFMKLRDTVFQNPDSFFRHYADLSHEEAVDVAKFIWRDINGKNLRENIAPTKSRAALDAAQRPRPPRHRRIPAPAVARSAVDEPGGEIGQRSELDEVLVVVDVFEVPQDRVWDVYTVPTERQDRQDVAAHAVADHAEPRRLDAEPRQDRGIGLGILLQHDLHVLEVVSQPARGDLVRLMDEVTFGDQDQPPVPADLGQDLRYVFEQAHRILELRSDHLDHLGHDPRRNPAATDGDRGLDHRQAERLDAVTEGGQVLALRRRQRSLGVHTLGCVRRDQFDEPLLVGAEPILAVPQGVIRIEADHVERAHGRLMPSICASGSTTRIRVFIGAVR